MKEENAILREQDMIRNELLQKFEQKHDQLQKEVDFYKEQNNDLLARIDNLETSCIVEAGEQLLSKQEGEEVGALKEMLQAEASQAQVETTKLLTK